MRAVTARPDAAGEFADQLEPLRFAAAERGTGLAELQIAEAGVAEQRERTVDFRVRREELRGLARASSPSRRRCCARCRALRAWRRCSAARGTPCTAVARRQEVHLHLDHALPGAGFAAAAFGVEGEAARRVAAHPRQRHLREELRGFRRRRRCRSPAWSARSCRSAIGRLRKPLRDAPRRRSVADRRSVPLRASVAASCAWRRCSAVRPLASARRASSVLLPEPEMPVMTLRRPSGKADIDVLQIVQRRAPQLEPALHVRRAAGARRASDAAAARAGNVPSRNRSMRWISSSVPCATTSPPRAPAPGPRSMIVSARRMVSSSCSTITQRVALCASALRACRAARRCRAGAGRWSARRARRARRADWSRAARRGGCAAISPPLSVFAERLSAR